MPQKRQKRSPEAPQPKRMPFGPSANPALTQAILAVVDQQIRDQRPPETRRTFERLVARGYAPEDARRPFRQHQGKTRNGTRQDTSKDNHTAKATDERTQG
jgi:hypothetical protein